MSFFHMKPKTRITISFLSQQLPTDENATWNFYDIKKIRSSKKYIKKND